MFRSFSSPRTLSWGVLLTYATLATSAAVPERSVPEPGKGPDPAGTPGSSATEEYDYVIVGGGLTGLVAAARLSEDPSVSVLVLEYGPFNRGNYTQIPYLGTTLDLTAFRNITSAPEPFLGGKTYPVRVSGIVGGGSQVNGMQFDRPSAADLDSWEMLDNPGWGWDSLEPYYKKSAQFTPPNHEIQQRYNYSYDTSAYGENSPVQVSFPDFQYPDMYNFVDAYDELGVPFIEEHALGNAIGAFWSPSSIDPKTKTRSSSLYAYYDPVSSRQNLKLLTMHQAVEVLFEEDSLTAAGVKAIDRSANQTLDFYAKREVILAAGAVFTPQLLQLSGIGPRAVLEAAGIETKLELNAVGSNFQDHATAYLNWTLTSSFPNPSTLATNQTFYAEAYRQYHEELTGPLTKASSSFIGFMTLGTATTEADSMVQELREQDAALYLPDMYAKDERLIAGFQAQREILTQQIEAGSVAVLEIPIAGSGRIPNSLQKPLSRGTVQLDASNPTGVPIVTHHTLQNPFDRTSMFRFLEFTRKMMATEAVSALNPVEVIPGVEHVNEDDVINELITSGALNPTFSHPSCSCPMMPEDKGGCVSSELLVYGTEKLSIIDASIIPLIPATHLQATMYAIAEKAADLIKARA